jgi:ADP-ribose pyrophosphatase YjhB (NUDIX family)
MADDHDIELVKRRLVCENTRFKIYFDRIRTPSGHVVPSYLVVAPKLATVDMITGVAILPIVDGKIGLVNVFRHPVRSFSWEMPRGFIESKEDPVVSAQRELKEETGLSCALENMQSLGVVTPEAGVLQARVCLFAALKCEQTSKKSKELGHKGFQFFSRAEIDRMVLNSEIQETTTMTAYLKYIKLNPNEK